MKMYKSSVGRFLLMFSILPTIVIGVVLTIISTSVIYNVKVDDTRVLLENSVRDLEFAFFGDPESDSKTTFKKEDSKYYILGNDISNQEFVCDKLKEYTGADTTVFYKDTRILTTIKRKDGSRYVGTKAEYIWKNYASKGQVFFGEDVQINNEEYFGYYEPIVDSEGKIYGMIFAGIPREDIKNTINRLNSVAVAVCIIMCIFTVFMCTLATRHTLKIQGGIIEYIEEIDKGNFKHKLSKSLIARKDEYGIMGRYLVKLNNSLQNLVQKDTLTKLYNRRAAMKYLEGYVSEANKRNGQAFSFAIGDIDFFKKVNDTYGHNCGDEVLKKVACIISVIDEDEGFTARWGGEEFIIVFKSKVEEAKKKLEEMLEEIRNTVVEYDGYEVSVTMTFGITEYIAPQKLDTLISNADLLLYKGKSAGRNQISS